MGARGQTGFPCCGFRQKKNSAKPSRRLLQTDWLIYLVLFWVVFFVKLGFISAAVAGVQSTFTRKEDRNDIFTALKCYFFRVLDLIRSAELHLLAVHVASTAPCLHNPVFFEHPPGDHALPFGPPAEAMEEGNA